MKEAYRRNYETYLRICKKQRLSETSEYKFAIKIAEDYRQQLIGMIDLMRDCEELTAKEAAEEFAKVEHDFEPLRLYKAYVRDGEVHVFMSPSYDEEIPVEECVEGEVLE